jgi:hypothetical protein
MKWFFTAVIAALLLASCGMFTPAGEIPVSEKLSVAAQAAQKAINEANVLLISFNNVVGQQKADAIITASERDVYLNRSDMYGEDLDKAQKALRAGDVVTAQNKAELVKKLIIALHREVAQAKRAP